MILSKNVTNMSRHVTSMILSKMSQVWYKYVMTCHMYDTFQKCYKYDTSMSRHVTSMLLSKISQVCQEMSKVWYKYVLTCHMYDTVEKCHKKNLINFENLDFRLWKLLLSQSLQISLYILASKKSWTYQWKVFRKNIHFNALQGLTFFSLFF